MKKVIITIVIFIIIISGMIYWIVASNNYEKSKEANENINSEQNTENISTKNKAITETELNDENINGIEDDNNTIDDNLIEYNIYSESDLSYVGCKRIEYRLIVSESATQKQIEAVLKDVYDKKKSLSAKIFIYAYVNENDDNYRGLLNMDPNCDNDDSYTIDFDYWEQRNY
ncbi:MAG: hypothetical protein ABIE68_05085 [bacterium]